MSVRATKSAPPTPPPAVKRMSAAAKPAPDEPCTKPLSREEVNAIVREHVLKMLNEGAAPDSLMASEVVRDLKPRYPDIRSSEVRSLFLQLRKEGVLTLLKPDLLQQACVLALPTQEEAKTIEEFIVKEMLGKGIPKDEILPLDVFNAIRPNHPLISINTIRIIMSRMRDNGIIERPSPVSLKRMNCQNKILDEETKYEDEVRRAKEDIARWEQDTQTVQCEYGQFHTLKVRSFADRMDRNACLIRLTEDLAIPYTESRSAGRAIVSVFQKDIELLRFYNAIMKMATASIPSSNTKLVTCIFSRVFYKIRTGIPKREDEMAMMHIARYANQIIPERRLQKQFWRQVFNSTKSEIQKHLTEFYECHDCESLKRYYHPA